MTVPSETVALWLLVGFQRSWLLWQVLSAAGLPSVRTDEEVQKLHEQYPFLPRLCWSYFGKRATPVRALVAAEWPKLFEYIEAHRNDSEKLAKLPTQIVNLKCVDKARTRLSTEDVAYARKTRYRTKVVTAGLDASATQRESASNWHTVKGPGKIRCGRMK